MIFEYFCASHQGYPLYWQHCYLLAAGSPLQPLPQLQEAQAAAEAGTETSEQSEEHRLMHVALHNKFGVEEIGAIAVVGED